MATYRAAIAAKNANISDRFWAVQRKFTQFAHTKVWKLMRLTHTVVQDIEFWGLI